MANWISDSCLIADISINKIQQSHVVEIVFKLVVRKTFHNSLFNLSLVYSNQKKNADYTALKLMNVVKCICTVSSDPQGAKYERRNSTEM